MKVYLCACRWNWARRLRTLRWWRFLGSPAASGAAKVERRRTSVTCWTLNRPIDPWWSTLARPADPRLWTSCRSSGGWWRTSRTWRISCSSTSMRLTRLTDGWVHPWNFSRSRWKNIAAWRSAWLRRRGSSNTSLSRRSAGWWPTAWTTTPTWRTVSPTKGCAS